MQYQYHVKYRCKNCGRTFVGTRFMSNHPILSMYEEIDRRVIRVVDKSYNYIQDFPLATSHLCLSVEDEIQQIGFADVISVERANPIGNLESDSNTL